MRKVAYINVADDTRKLMIYCSEEGVYLFGYDCLQDTSSSWDNWFSEIEEAEDYCQDKYSVDKDDWINISDPIADCQHDFIIPTRIKGKEIGKPEWGQFQSLINGKWIDNPQTDKCLNFGGLTGNERLFVSGLIYEFDKAKLEDKLKAIKILKVLRFDSKSIDLIVFDG